METKTFKLFTNNSIYNCYVMDSDTQIEFLLPYGILNQTSYIRNTVTKDKNVVLLPAEQLRIKICLTVLSKTAPKVVIKCENENSIVYGSDVKIEPEACQLLSFVSFDSGYTWSVVNNVYGKVDVDNKLKELSDALSAEVMRATNIEQQISANLYSETTRATKAETNINNKLTTETTRATEAETALDTKISAETTRATKAETALDTKISAETTRATEAETTLNGKVTTLENAGYQTADDINTILTNGNYVVDANYVHTDNNYTDEDKNKVNTIDTRA